VVVSTPLRRNLRLAQELALVRARVESLGPVDAPPARPPLG
jgi:hypothetical protein